MAGHDRRSATFITMILVAGRVVVGPRVYDVAVLANLRNIVIAVTHQFLSEGCTSSNRDPLDLIQRDLVGPSLIVPLNRGPLDTAR